MGLDLEYLQGQTPLDEDEISGLRVATIATRGELDEFEQQNIEQAIEWTLKRSFKPRQILTESFVKEVHRRMYGDVWAWAGEYRKTEKNIGISKWKIAPQLKALLDDTIYWIENSVYAPDEIAVRFKHRIVSIHCFANGNGRHSRLMADIIASKIFKQPVFTWGAANLVRQGDARSEYLKAVKTADAGDVQLLIAFARS
jgi:Fic-DOC domain mobile mystery protein B